MVGRSAYYRQTGSIIYAFAMCQCFKRYQSLIVIHSQHGIKLLVSCYVQKMHQHYKGPYTNCPCCCNGSIAGFMMCLFFIAYLPVITCMWIKSQYSDLRLVYTKIFYQCFRAVCLI